MPRAADIPDVVARGPAYGDAAFKPVVGAEPRPEETVSNEAFAVYPGVREPDQYTPPTLSQEQFRSANLAEGEGRIGFRRTEKLGESSRITITHSGIAFGRATGEGMTQSQSSRGGRFNVQLPGGYYFRGAR